MITLLIEICLACKAWKKGWKGWALLPFGIGYGFCFMVGMAIGANGGSPEDAFGVALVTELGIIVTLAVMAAKQRKGLPTNCQEDADGSDVVVAPSHRNAA